MGERKIKIGMLGLGTVGRGVYKILTANTAHIDWKLNSEIEIKKILVRNINADRGITLPEGILTTNADDILEDPEIQIVVEVLGGITATFDYVIKAMNNGKSVVTANKDMVAAYGKELFDTAKRNNVDIMFEASVAGGIPIIKPLKESLPANNISEIIGIVNGTTNYILTKMTNEGASFDEALAEAKVKGYAEADPTSDVEGLDSARKLAILASISFNSRIVFDDVYVEGISNIEKRDIQYAREELNSVIKLLAVAKNTDNCIEVRVHPTIIPINHPLASVNDVYNAVYIKGDAVGDTMFYGRGAGEMPTASAVVADIMDVVRNINSSNQGRIGCTCYTHLPIKDIGDIYSSYYMRVEVVDKPGVMASVTDIFGKQKVSLQSIIQKTSGEDAEIVMVTHEVKERNMREALKMIETLPNVKKICNVIRVETN